MIRKTEEIKTQWLRIIIIIRLMIRMMIRMIIIVKMMIMMMMRLIITDDKNNHSYKNDDK